MSLYVFHADSEDTEQTGRLPRVFGHFAGYHVFYNANAEMSGTTMEAKMFFVDSNECNE